MTTNWRAMQVYGCKQPDFEKPYGIKARGMSGGCWKANLYKDGTRYIRSRGGAPKPKKKTKPHIHFIQPTVQIDKKGFVIL